MEHAKIVGDIKLWVVYEDETKKDLELKVSLEDLMSADISKTWEFKMDLPGYYDVLQKVSNNTFIKKRLHYTAKRNLYTSSSIKLKLEKNNYYQNTTTNEFEFSIKAQDVQR